jgi:hypothetical protein
VVVDVTQGPMRTAVVVDVTQEHTLQTNIATLEQCKNLSIMPAVKRRRASHAKARRSRTRSRKSSAPRRTPRIAEAPFPHQKLAKLRHVENIQSRLLRMGSRSR